MGDSKIVRQLRFHSGGNAPGAGQGEAPVRGYGSGHQAQRPRAVVNSQTAPGAPDGPVGNQRIAARAVTSSPHPHNGLTRRPGVIPVTPGIGEDNVKVTRALAPSQRALESQQASPHYPPIGGASSGVQRTIVRPVVLANGFTRDQRDLLDALLDKCHDSNIEDEADATEERRAQRAELAQLATETKQAVAQFPVLDRATDDSNAAAGDVEDISAPAPAPASSGAPSRSARPARVSGMGGTNPPGEVRIFAPNTQPFETKAGRRGDDHADDGQAQQP